MGISRHQYMKKRLSTIWNPKRLLPNPQWNDSESIELHTLGSPSSISANDYSYQSHLIKKSIKNNSPRKSKLRRSGWRFGATSCATSASIVFLINLAVTIWGSVHDKANGDVLYDGDCDQVNSLNRGLHLIINLLSTVLLSSSNYCMQCLSAPTRKEIDAAHAKRVWLDIGVPSIHNLKRISKTRALLWLLIGISSLPLHLFYNSVVFSSISVNSYFAFSVSQSFVDDADCFNCNNVTEPYREPIRRMQEKARNNELEKLSNTECIEQYAEVFQTKRSNVLLVASDNNFPPTNESVIGATRVYGMNAVSAGVAANPQFSTNIYDWICSSDNSSTYAGSAPRHPGPNACINIVDEIKSASDVWNVSGRLYQDYYLGEYQLRFFTEQSERFPIDYCLSERAEEHCKLRFILSIAVLVTILNLFKAALFFYVAFGIEEEPLMTIGDAVACFLEKEDTTTKGVCLLSVYDVKESKGRALIGVKEWTGKQHRWKDIASSRRQTITILMLIFSVIAAGLLYRHGVNSLPDGTSHNLASLARLGFGAVDARTVIFLGSELTTIQSILLANIVQPILSFIYFSYNGLLTCMLLGYEWCTYAYQRKGLRVSRSPIGSQRSTYFLQLPYRFALPFMVLSAILHWLASQSIFLLAIDAYDWDGSKSEQPDSFKNLNMLAEEAWKSCGYSPIAIFTVLVLGSLMVVAILGFGFVPYRQGINLAGSCSAAISAACHLKEDEIDGYTAAMEKLQWGVVDVNAEGVGHCAFSTKEVKHPKKGKTYR